MTKKLTIGEYTIKIKYNDETSELDIQVFDELGDLIEAMQINNDDEVDDTEDIKFNLN